MKPRPRSGGNGHIVKSYDVLDYREREISHGVLRLLALRQPIARDLREILAALRIASDYSHFWVECELDRNVSSYFYDALH